MASVDLDIVNSALSRLQVGEIVDFTTRQKGRTCKRIFDENYKWLLEVHDWNFPRKKDQLSNTGTAPAAHWDYAFDLPGDLMGEPVAVYQSDDDEAPPYKHWTRFGHQIFSDVSTIYMDYKHDIDHGRWPNYFRTLVRMVCQADFATPFCEDQSKQDKMMQAAFGLPSEQGMGGYFRIARQIDAKGEPSPRIKDFTLIAARMGNRARWAGR